MNISEILGALGAHGRRGVYVCGRKCMCEYGPLIFIPVQIYSNIFNPAHIYPDLFYLFKSLLTYSILFHRPQRYANIFQCIQLYADLYTLYRAAVTT